MAYDPPSRIVSAESERAQTRRLGVCARMQREAPVSDLSCPSGGATLRVLHVIDNLRLGGAQELVASIIKHGGEAFSYSCVAFVGPGPVGEELAAMRVPVEYLAARRSSLPIALVRMKRALRRIRPDIVNLHLECSTLMGLLFGMGDDRRKCVVSIHALKQQLPRWFYPPFKHLVHRADRVIVSDRVSARQVAACGYPPDRIHPVPIGTDYLDRSVESQKHRGRIREEFGIRENARIVLNVARLHTIKGQTHLLRAFRSVREQVSGVKLLIVGWGPLEKELKALAARLDLADSVIFTGPRRDLERFYAEADIFVMTSLQENMGVVIYQAMAMGLPVVAYDAGTIAEIVEHGRTGRLVTSGDVDALADALASLLNAPGTVRKEMGASARRVIETDYSAETMARRYEEVYLSLRDG